MDREHRKREPWWNFPRSTWNSWFTISILSILGKRWNSNWRVSGKYCKILRNSVKNLSQSPMQLSISKKRVKKTSESWRAYGKNVRTDKLQAPWGQEQADLVWAAQFEHSGRNPRMHEWTLSQQWASPWEDEDSLQIAQDDSWYW